ncbi:TPC6B protein, partial [Amia calva]|nr:TPC6B protein [Amia calva]
MNTCLCQILLSSSTFDFCNLKPCLTVRHGFHNFSPSRFTRDTPSFKDDLDIMKFLCKDFWINVFRKQIDNLRTNHQGTYVLQDNRFRLLTQFSNSKQYLEEAPKYLAYSCGMVRGALSNLGMDSVVTADVSTLPACEF